VEPLIRIILVSVTFGTFCGALILYGVVALLRGEMWPEDPNDPGGLVATAFGVVFALLGVAIALTPANGTWR
jgi:hypothetical protein